jgi:hypothetical protein
VLKTLARSPLERRRTRARGPSLAEVVERFPAVEVLIDSHEQRIRRPTGWSKQKPYYSGKKKAHTLKCQATVSLTGRVQAISRSVPGSTSDPTLLKKSGVLRRLKPSEGVGVDKGRRHRQGPLPLRLLRAIQEAAGRRSHRGAEAV